MNENLWIGFLAMALGAATYVASGQYVGVRSFDPIGPAFFPRIMAMILMGTGAVLAIRAWVLRNAPQSPPSVTMPPEIPASAFGQDRLVRALAICVGYLFMLKPLGYLIATPLFVAFTIGNLGIGDRKTQVVTGVGVTLVLFVVFAVLLDVLLPMGVWADWLGL
jgi:putative tricarboxylic transport membrane protein